MHLVDGPFCAEGTADKFAFDDDKSRHDIFFDLNNGFEKKPRSASCAIVRQTQRRAETCLG
jgi:hypothetical protein